MRAANPHFHAIRYALRSIAHRARLHYLESQIEVEKQAAEYHKSVAIQCAHNATQLQREHLRLRAEYELGTEILA